MWRVAKMNVRRTDRALRGGCVCNPGKGPKTGQIASKSCEFGPIFNADFTM